MTDTDFDGCSRHCRIQGSHTLTWGRCEHAAEPEPTVMLGGGTFTAPDGDPAIRLECIPVSMLAERIEAVLLRLGLEPRSVLAIAARTIAADLAEPTGES